MHGSYGSSKKNTVPCCDVDCKPALPPKAVLFSKTSSLPNGQLHQGSLVWLHKRSAGHHYCTVYVHCKNIRVQAPQAISNGLCIEVHANCVNTGNRYLDYSVNIANKL
eukprot:5581-Heterococcus_DN1.PRE.1